MKIAVAGDSAGVPLVDVIEAHLKAKGMHEVVNLSKSGFYADLAAHVGRGFVLDADRRQNLGAAQLEVGAAYLDRARDL